MLLGLRASHLAHEAILLALFAPAFCSKRIQIRADQEIGKKVRGSQQEASVILRVPPNFQIEL